MTNEGIVDAFTLAHIAGGMMTRAVTGNRLLAYVIIVGYELVEKPWLKTLPETPVNQVADMLTSILGWEALNAMPEGGQNGGR